MAADTLISGLPVLSGVAPEQAKNLAEVRDAVAAVDAALLELLNRRAALSVRAGELKRTAGDASVFRPGREAAQRRALEALNSGPLPNGHLHAVYREILSSSRALQGPQRIAVAGPDNGPVHAAARKALGTHAELVPQADAAAVFAVVESGDCRFGVVAPEAGKGRIAELFFHSGLSLLAVFSGPQRYFLVGREEPEDSPESAEVCAVLFSFDDVAASVDAVSAVFAARGFALDTCFSGFADGGSRHIFLAVFSGYAAGRLWADAAQDAARLCRDFRLVGCCPVLL